MTEIKRYKSAIRIRIRILGNEVSPAQNVKNLREVFDSFFFYFFFRAGNIYKINNDTLSRQTLYIQHINIEKRDKKN